MSDRVQVVIAVPRDAALPVDVQGVGLRRKAIDLMQEIVAVNENSVRYGGASEDCIVTLGEDAVSMWQMNMLAVRFTADGKAHEGVCGPAIHADLVTRVRSAASVVRDEFAR